MFSINMRLKYWFVYHACNREGLLVASEWTSVDLSVLQGTSIVIIISLFLSLFLCLCLSLSLGLLDGCGSWLFLWSLGDICFGQQSIYPLSPCSSLSHSVCYSLFPLLSSFSHTVSLNGVAFSGVQLCISFFLS